MKYPIAIKKVPDKIIGELQKLKTAVEVNRTRFYNVVERSLDGIIVIDKEGIIKYINPAALDMFGRNIATLLGEEFGIPIRGNYTTEFRVLNQSRGELFTEMRVADIEWSGEKGYLASLRDVTERKRSEDELKKAKEEIDHWNKVLEIKVAERTEELKKSQEQLIHAEKLSAIGKLASSVAHELNNPLSGILGLLRMYKKDEKEGTQSYKEIHAMLNAAEHMAKVVGDLSSFSRRSEEMFEKLDIEDAIDSVSSFGLDQLAKNSIKITKQIDKNLPKIYGNKRQLQQVILNMITNARDAMPQGGAFTIKAKSSSDNKNIVMEFIDTGTGIEEKNLKRLFEPFFTTKEIGKGIGLGLSVSYGIIKAHRGDIAVESAPGKGTKFTITLPVADTAV